MPPGAMETARPLVVPPVNRGPAGQWEEEAASSAAFGLGPVRHRGARGERRGGRGGGCGTASSFPRLAARARPALRGAPHAPAPAPQCVPSALINQHGLRAATSPAKRACNKSKHACNKSSSSGKRLPASNVAVGKSESVLASLSNKVFISKPYASNVDPPLKKIIKISLIVTLLAKPKHKASVFFVETLINGRR